MSTPARLHKVEKKEVTFMDIIGKLENVLLRYGHILIPIAILLALLGFVAFCFLICGASAVESGVEYNAFERII